MLLNNYEYIIFDWDNTLVDSLGVIETSYKDVLMYFNRFDLIEDIQKLQIGKAKSAKQEFSSLFGENNLQKSLEIFYKSFEQNHLDYLKTMDDCENVLNFLNNNKTIFVNSNKRHDLLEKEIKHLNLLNYFKNFCGAGFCKMDKPSPFGVEYLLKNYDYKKDNVLYIGDSNADFETAKNFGCDFCQIGDDNIFGIPTYKLNKLKDLLNV